MAEDDVYFISKGWEDIYIENPRPYICYYNKLWGNKKETGDPFQSQGAFCKITKEVIDRIGYYDVKNMGFRGIGHLDYALRYSREFKESNFYDIKDSNSYIKMILDDYKHSLPREEVLKHRRNQAKKIKIARERTLNYISFSV